MPLKLVARAARSAVSALTACCTITLVGRSPADICVADMLPLKFAAVTAFVALAARPARAA